MLSERMMEGVKDSKCCLLRILKEGCESLGLVGGPKKYPTCNVLIEPVKHRKFMPCDPASRTSSSSMELEDIYGRRKSVETLAKSIYHRNTKINCILEEILEDVSMAAGKAGAKDVGEDLDSVRILNEVTAEDLLKELGLWDWKTGKSIYSGHLTKKDLALLDVSVGILTRLIPLFRYVGNGELSNSSRGKMGRALLEIATRAWREVIERRNLGVGLDSEEGHERSKKWQEGSAKMPGERSRLEGVRESKVDEEILKSMKEEDKDNGEKKVQRRGGGGSNDEQVLDLWKGRGGSMVRGEPLDVNGDSYDYYDEVQQLAYQSKLEVIRTVCPHLVTFDFGGSRYGAALLDMIFDSIVTHYHDLFSDSEGKTSDGSSAAGKYLLGSSELIEGLIKRQVDKVSKDEGGVVVNGGHFDGTEVNGKVENGIAEWISSRTAEGGKSSSFTEKAVDVSELSMDELMVLVITGIFKNGNYLNDPGLMRRALLEAELRTVQTAVQMMNTQLDQLDSPGYMVDGVKMRIVPGIDGLGQSEKEGKGGAGIEALTMDELMELLKEGKYESSRSGGKLEKKMGSDEGMKDGGIFKGLRMFRLTEIQDEIGRRVKMRMDLQRQKDTLLSTYYSKLKKFYATCQEAGMVEGKCPENIEKLLDDMLSRLQAVVDELNEPESQISHSEQELTSKRIVEKLVTEILDLSDSIWIKAGMTKVDEASVVSSGGVGASGFIDLTEFSGGGKKVGKYLTRTPGKGTVGQASNVEERRVNENAGVDGVKWGAEEEGAGGGVVGGKRVKITGKEGEEFLGKRVEGLKSGDKSPESVASLALVNNVVIDDKSNVIGIFNPDTFTVSSNDGETIGFVTESGEVVVYGGGVGVLGAGASVTTGGLYRAVPRRVKQGSPWMKEASVIEEDGSKEDGRTLPGWRDGKEIQLLMTKSEDLLKRPDLIMSEFFPEEMEMAVGPFKRGPAWMLEELLQFEKSEVDGGDVEGTGREGGGLRFVDGDGKVLGELRSDRRVVDERERPVGRMNSDGLLVTESGENILFPDSTIVDDNWLIVGSVKRTGVVKSVVEEDRYLIGGMRNDGRIFGQDGVFIGRVMGDGVIVAPNNVVMGRLTSKWELVGRDGVPFAYITSEGKIYRYDVLEVGSRLEDDEDARMGEDDMRPGSREGSVVGGSMENEDAIRKKTAWILVEKEEEEEKEDGDNEGDTEEEKTAKAAHSALPSLRDILEDLGGGRRKETGKSELSGQSGGTEVIDEGKYSDTLTPEEIVKLLADLNYKMGAALKKSEHVGDEWKKAEVVGVASRGKSRMVTGVKSGLERKLMRDEKRAVETFKLPSHLSLTQRSKLARNMAEDVVDDLFKFALTHLLLQAEAGDDTTRIMDCLARIETADETDEIAQAMWKPEFHKSYHKDVLTYDRSKPFYVPRPILKTSVVDPSEGYLADVQVLQEERKVGEELRIHHHRHHHRHHHGAH